MTVLAIDTTSEFGSLAVRSNGQTVAELSLHSSDGFAHVLFPAIERVLGQAGLRLEDVDRFAAASGPGSFSGLRVGLSAAKGLAEAMGKPAVAVSNLKALASFGTSPLRAVVLDARRGEVYAAVYDSNLERVLPEAVLKFSVWIEQLRGSAYEFISHTRLPLEGTPFADMPFVEAPRFLATAVAICAEGDTPSDPAVLDANYVRRSDAELFWKEE